MAAHQNEEQECCLCGDIGFPKDLLPCPVCGFRLQHTYCSRSYPIIDMKTWRCEWCIYEEDQKREPRSRLRIKGSVPLDLAGCQDPDETDHGMRKEENNKRPLPTTARSPKPRKHKGLDRPKKQLHCTTSSSSRPAACRRYKLLADVMC